MRMLLDTGTVTNAGNLTYHLWVMSEYPEMVGIFLQYDMSIEYHIIQLLAALDIDTIQFPTNYCNMISIIRYHTPYIINKRDSLLISFVLGNDVSLRWLLSLPTLLALSGRIDLVKGELSCSEINHSFNITLHPSAKGLPEGIMFDNTTPIIPSGVYFNIKPVRSSIHYASTEDHTISSPKPSYSDNGRIPFCGNASRHLEYVSKLKWYIVRERCVVAGMNNSEFPRLNSSKLRSQLNLNSFDFWTRYSLTCCNFVEPCSVNCVCNNSKQQPSCIPIVIVIFCTVYGFVIHFAKYYPRTAS